MTCKLSLAAIRATGCTARHIAGEYRVNLPRSSGGSEATAYYTTDAADAIHTANAMALAAADRVVRGVISALRAGG